MSNWSLPGLRTGLLGSAALGAIAIASPAWAQTRSFDIPAQPAASGVAEFARQADVQLLISAADARGRRTNAVRGTYTVGQALRLLLQDTGLVSQETGAQTYTVVPAAQAIVAAEGGEPVKVSELVVTGTRLQGVSPTSPVITYSREDFDRGGYTTVQDMMARVPQNFTSLSPATGTSGSNVGLTTQVDLRGLGSQATLTLVNGRRVAGAAGNSGRAFDITMIPVAAVDRLDVLTDGASALYGSDAIGGVVNIVLRKDFDGAETSVQYGIGEGDRESLMLSQLLGATWRGGHAMAAVQYDRRDPVSSQSIGLDTLDFTARGGGDFRVQGFGAPGTVYPAGFFAGQPFATIHGPGGSPVFFAALPPGDGTDLDVADLALNQRSVFDPIPVDALASQENVAAYVTVEQEIGPVTLFADGVFARRTGVQRLIPNSTFIPVPPSNAFSPFAEPVLVGYVFSELGPITARPESQGWFVNLGARGRFGFGDWTWEIVGSRSEDEFSTAVSGINSPELARRLASPDPSVAFNPFGDGSGNSQAVIDAVTTEFAFGGESNMTSIGGQAQGALARLPGGALRLVVGAEHRDEDVDTRVTQFGVPNALFPNASRNAQAVFAEAYVPLFGAENARPGFQELALSFAGRGERYSDFGEAFNPKIGVLWRPAAGLTLKANWGTSFRAPGLRELFAVTRVQPNTQVFDPHAPGGARTVFVSQMFGGNPNLQPEEAETYTVTASWRPGALPGFRAGAGYFHTDYTDRIRGTGEGLTADFLLSIESDLPSGIIVRGPDGNLQTINLVNVNAATTKIAGFDFDLGYGWTSAALGSFDLSAAATVFTRYDEQLINGAPVLELKGVVGNPPDWRARGTVSWSRGPWGAAVNVNFTDGFTNTSTDPRIRTRDVDAWTTVDAQLSYTPGADAPAWLEGVSVRLGAINLFDADPPFVDGPIGFDPRNHSLDGRTVYLRLTKAFGGGR